MDSTRALLEVQAGVLPGTPELTRQWAIASSEWNAQGADQAALLVEVNGKALGFSQLLMLQPDRYNWVRMEWFWL